MKKKEKENISADNEIDFIEIINILISHWKLIVVGTIAPVIIFMAIHIFITRVQKFVTINYHTPELTFLQFNQLRNTLISNRQLKVLNVETVPALEPGNKKRLYSIIKISIYAEKMENYNAFVSDIDKNLIQPVLAKFSRKNLIDQYLGKLESSQFELSEKVSLNREIDQLNEILKGYRKLRERLGGGHKTDIPSTVILENDGKTTEAEIQKSGNEFKKDKGYYYISLDQQIMAMETMLVDKKLELNFIEKYAVRDAFLINHFEELLRNKSHEDDIKYFNTAIKSNQGKFKESDYNLLKEFIFTDLPSVKNSYKYQKYSTDEISRGSMKKGILLFIASASLMVLVSFVSEFFRRNRDKLKLNV